MQPNRLYPRFMKDSLSKQPAACYSQPGLLAPQSCFVKVILLTVLLMVQSTLFADSWTKSHFDRNPPESELRKMLTTEQYYVTQGKGTEAPFKKVNNPALPPANQETIVFAGGCFWGVQAVFQHVKGVISATSGYAGGTLNNPTYSMVSTGNTGYAESVKVIYDPSQVSFATLLKVFFSVAHDPTELNRQGPDIGTQYRSALFYTTDKQKQIAEAYIKQLNSAKTFTNPIVTQVNPLDVFYTAEDYHQNYAAKHPKDSYILICDIPKVEKLQKEFPELWLEKKN